MLFSGPGSKALRFSYILISKLASLGSWSSLGLLGIPGPAQAAWATWGHLGHLGPSGAIWAMGASHIARRGPGPDFLSDGSVGCWSSWWLGPLVD